MRQIRAGDTGATRLGFHKLGTQDVDLLARIHADTLCTAVPPENVHRLHGDFTQLVVILAGKPRLNTSTVARSQ